MIRYGPLCGGLAAAAALSPAFQPDCHAELLLTLESGGITNSLIVSNACLRVEANRSPDPFLPPGPFSAVWTGELWVDLRGDYEFGAEYEGDVEVSIHQTNVLSRVGSASGSRIDWAPPTRLRKGANPLRVRLTRTNAGPASLRLLWRNRALPPGPIPSTAFSPGPPPQAGPFEREARGRALFLDARCGRCHAVSTSTPVPDLAQDAPSFQGIGSRLQFDWLRRWVLDPTSLRPNSTMPRLLHGSASTEAATAIATWLASLQEAVPAPPPNPAPPPALGHAAVGKSIAASQHCAVCHVLPGETPDPANPDAIDLRAAAAKFQPGALARFLRSPAAHFPWTRMPDYRFTESEASHLATWLDDRATTSPASVPKLDPALVARGMELAETLGCLACHPGPATQRASAKPLAALPAPAWSQGCLAETPPGTNGHPSYSFTTSQRLDLRAFAATDRASLGRHVPHEFAIRWQGKLRCNACHSGLEGIPAIAGAGDKLRPEWMARLLSGQVPVKSRTWLPARMPAFATLAEPLANGLASIHGRPDRSPAESPIDETAAADGRKLVSATGGFACVTCHAIGDQAVAAVFESPGINFSRTGERLLPDYFTRWVRNPQLIDPTTKMPLYFDEEGNSALTDFYGGDGPRTLRALWEYIRLGPRMQPPTP